MWSVSFVMAQPILAKPPGQIAALALACDGQPPADADAVAHRLSGLDDARRGPGRCGGSRDDLQAAVRRGPARRAARHRPRDRAALDLDRARAPAALGLARELLGFSHGARRAGPDHPLQPPAVPHSSGNGRAPPPCTRGGPVVWPEPAVLPPAAVALLLGRGK